MSVGGYEIRIRKQGHPWGPWLDIGLTTNYQWTGLDPDSVYQVQTRAYCDSGSVGGIDEEVISTPTAPQEGGMEAPEFMISAGGSFPFNDVDDAWIVNPVGSINNERWGLQAGDIMLVILEGINEPVVFAQPMTGFEEAPDSPVVNTTGGDDTKLSVFWKRAVTNEPQIILQPVTDHIITCLLIIRGCIETGNPWDYTGTSQGSGSSVVGPSATTTEHGELVVHASGCAVLPTVTNLQYVNAQAPDLTNVKIPFDTWTATGNDGSIRVMLGDKEQAGAVGAFTATLFTPGNWTVWTGTLRRNVLDRPRVVGPIGSRNTEVASGLNAPFMGTGADHPFSPSPEANDIVVVFAESANEDVTTPTPGGWDAVPGLPVNNLGTNPTRLTGIWRRLTGEEDSRPAFYHSGTIASCQLYEITGVVTTGDPWDVTTSVTGSGTNAVIPGGTTTQDNCLVISTIEAMYFATTSTAFTTWSNSDLTSLTEIRDFASTSSGVTASVVGNKATAGSFGSTTATTTASVDFAGWTGALRGASGVPVVARGSTGAGGGFVTTSSLGVGYFDPAENSILLAIVAVNSDIGTVDAPPGWTEAPNSPVTNNSGSVVQLQIFWRRCSGLPLYPRLEGADPNTFTGNHRIDTVGLFRGCLETGNPWGETATNTGTGTTITCPSVDTTEDRSLIVNAFSTTRDINSQRGTFSLPTNTNLDSLVMQADRVTSVGNGGGCGYATGIKEELGTTGTTTVTQATSVEWTAFTGVLRPKADV
jgi:hypothetical protein